MNGKDQVIIGSFAFFFFATGVIALVGSLLILSFRSPPIVVLAISIVAFAVSISKMPGRRYRKDSKDWLMDLLFSGALCLAGLNLLWMVKTIGISLSSLLDVLKTLVAVCDFIWGILVLALGGNCLRNIIGDFYRIQKEKRSAA
jgi:hypothetical protein